MKIFFMPLILSLVASSHFFTPGKAEAAGTTLASSMDIYVFPKKGQQADQQSIDEAACYEWAVNNSGADPFELQKQAGEQAEQTQQSKAAAQQSKKGAGVQGAVAGAAAGALIGEIADDDAGKGAAVGAAVGGIASRRRASKAAKQETTQAEEKGEAQQQATQQQIENFKKAFSACLEAKEYLVKY